MHIFGVGETNTSSNQQLTGFMEQYLVAQKYTRYMHMYMHAYACRHPKTHNTHKLISNLVILCWRCVLDGLYLCLGKVFFFLLLVCMIKEQG